MKTIGEIFTELKNEGLFDEFSYLGAQTMLSDKDILWHQLQGINRDEYVYIENTSNYNDILKGEQYNVMFDIKNPKKYQKVFAEIDFVSLKKNDTIDLLPRGYGGVVRLKFKNKVPEMLKILKQDGSEKLDLEKHSYVYFTTQEVIDRILKAIEKDENVNRKYNKEY
ncbi:hypothetical protein [Flavobacterium microcysteis]